MLFQSSDTLSLIVFHTPVSAFIMLFHTEVAYERTIFQAFSIVIRIIENTATALARILSHSPIMVFTILFQLLIAFDFIVFHMPTRNDVIKFQTEIANAFARLNAPMIKSTNA